MQRAQRAQRAQRHGRRRRVTRAHRLRGGARDGISEGARLIEARRGGASSLIREPTQQSKVSVEARGRKGHVEGHCRDADRAEVGHLLREQVVDAVSKQHHRIAPAHGEGEG